MTDLILSFLKIAASIGLLAIVLALVARWMPIARAHAEVRRKLIHVSLGAYCLLLPVIFEHAWEVWLACALTVGIFTLARGRLRATLGCGLHAVQRTRDPVTMFLVNGVMLQGEIAAFDLFCMLLERDGMAQLVYKHAISTVQPSRALDLSGEPGDKE